MLSAGYSELNENYFTLSSAKKLIKQAFLLDALPHGTEINLYEGRDSALIFVQFPRIFYRFANFEDVISACKSCQCENSSLYFYDEEYILSVSHPAVYFLEFAEPELRDPLFELFLREHGRIIAEHDAVNFVKNLF